MSHITVFNQGFNLTLTLVSVMAFAKNNPRKTVKNAMVIFRLLPGLLKFDIMATIRKGKEIIAKSIHIKQLSTKNKPDTTTYTNCPLVTARGGGAARGGGGGRTRRAGQKAPI